VRPVNLLPRDDSKGQRPQPGAVTLTAVLGGVLVTALLAGLFLTTSSTVGDRQAEVDGLRAELAAIPPPPESTGQTTLETEKSQRVTVLGQALGSRVAWDRMLREISLVLPEDIWLESLNANAPDATAAAAAPGTQAGKGAFTITGYSYSHDGVARLLARLSVLPQLERPTLGSSVLDKSKPRSVVKFTISAALRGGAA
jgi:Tfp pilus assembly protein PilN